MSASQFKVKEIVWAKVRDCPWWPATIVSVEGNLSGEPKYIVDFIGEDSHAIVSKEFVKDYNTHYSEHIAASTPALRNAIRIANDAILKMYFGEFEEEMDVPKRVEVCEETSCKVKGVLRAKKVTAETNESECKKTSVKKKGKLVSEGVMTRKKEKSNLEKVAGKKREKTDAEKAANKKEEANNVRSGNKTKEESRNEGASSKKKGKRKANEEEEKEAKEREAKEKEAKVRKVEGIPFGPLDMKGLDKKLGNMRIGEEYTIIYVPVKVLKSEAAKFYK
eukprot:TRINITY_DN10682_c0_g2_i1.p1 TRINITY_DN10682_c0_g2~~TRINITY_DN10682_c0_g2_i1.p1  ORF type:complete len:278 (-),score=65.21 TRINITY_DN10682_c0_g2_i1:118-951(-)